MYTRDFIMSTSARWYFYILIYWMYFENENGGIHPDFGKLYLALNVTQWLEEKKKLHPTRPLTAGKCRLEGSHVQSWRTLTQFVQHPIWGRGRREAWRCGGQRPRLELTSQRVQPPCKWYRLYRMHFVCTWPSNSASAFRRPTEFKKILLK